MKKVLVAMSGGIDSSVAAALLKKQGYEVIGIFYHLWKAECPEFAEWEIPENKCCSSESLSRARAIALKLKMPFYTLDFKKEFKNCVVDYFIYTYSIGQTPNPCIECNRWIKFGILLRKAKELGCEYIATGHYARIKNGFLYRALDKKKDQSYFLYTLTKANLKNILFPIGDYTKAEVKKLGKKLGIGTLLSRMESQDVCFYPEKNHRAFLKRHLKLKEGDIVDKKEKILGKHQGLPLYTIGQRKGIGISGMKKPMFVIGFDLKKNYLIVGEEKDLMRKEFFVDNISWIDGKAPKEIIAVQIRYKSKVVKVKRYKAEGKRYKIELEKKVRAVTPGQSAVFYDGNKVLGGGIIC